MLSTFKTEDSREQGFTLVELLDRLRDLLLLATTGALPPLAEIATAERQAGWKSVVDRLGIRGLTIACEVLQSALAARSPQPRIALEVAASRILLALVDSVDVNAALVALTQQVAALSNRSATYVPPPLLAGAPNAEAERPGVVQAPSGMIAGVDHDYSPGGTQDAPASVPASAATAAGPVDAAAWDRVLQAVSSRKRTAWMALNGNQYKFLRAANGVLVLGVPNMGVGEGFRNSGNEAILIEAANETLGNTWTVQYEPVPA